MKTLHSLKIGDTIGVFSSSSPTTPEAVEKMKNYFSDLGYHVKIAQNTLKDFGFMAGTPYERASDFNSLIIDEEVKMVMTSTGGKSACHLLPLIDFDAIADNPKIIVGLSDSSILLNAISYISDIPTFHGPNGYSFGHTTPTLFSENNFWPLVNNEMAIPHEFPVSDLIKVLKGVDKVEGRIFGGHLGTIRNLIGTKWMPDLSGVILIIEEIFAELNFIDSVLCHLRLSGNLDKIAALIIGQPVECNENNYTPKENLEDIVLRNCSEYNFPIISNIPLGHTEDKITIPIGCKVELDTNTPSLKLLENPFIQ